MCRTSESVTICCNINIAPFFGCDAVSYPILGVRISCFVLLRPPLSRSRYRHPPLKSETVWTGELWSKRVLLILETKRIALVFLSFLARKKIYFLNFLIFWEKWFLKIFWDVGFLTIFDIFLIFICFLYGFFLLIFLGHFWIFLLDFWLFWILE